MKIAVTGRHGQVVRSLIERSEGAGVQIIALGRPEIDLAQPQTIFDALAATRPDVVVNAAAYTAVDQAESETESALAINGAGAGAVASAAARLQVPVIQLSTDYVFDGELDRPYVETDQTNPLGVYGRSKLFGEEAVAKATPDHAILRTAWAYSPFGKNFVRTMLNLAKQREEISVVADQHGAPTSALDIADGVIVVAKQLAARPDDASLRGTFHMVSQNEATWADFAEAIFSVSRELGGPSARVIRIPTSSYPTPARRPKNSRLNCDRLAAAYGVRLPPWQAALPTCVERLLKDR